MSARSRIGRVLAAGLLGLPVVLAINAAAYLVKEAAQRKYG